MSTPADIVVIGLGATGSSTLLSLARRGRRVLGIDRFRPPHTHGSTHGLSRVIRQAYYESPVYVPLVRRAYELWSALERDSGRSLLRKTGGLMLGAPDSALIQGATRSAVEHGLQHEMLNAAEIRRRFSIFRPSPEEVGVFEPEAGFLDPEGSIDASLRLAEGAGATVWTEITVLGWRRAGDGLVLETSRGAVSCGTAIVAGGAWAGALLESSGVPLTVERQVMYWFRPAAGAAQFSADHAPVFIWEWSSGRLIYGIPDHGAGFKVARHHEGEPVVPDQVDRTIHPDEIAAMRAILSRTIPELKAPPVDAVTCLYTNTPDHHFVLGAHPGEPRLLIGSACSGHGFKFATVLGEVLADLATVGASRFDLSAFRPDRFGSSAV